MDKKPKVFVGVSGGVDSSVALALLKNEGYDVTGVFLKVWSPDFLPCDWREERRSAMRVCAVLDVPFLTLDCEKEYKEEVVDYMIREYSNGRVPNPDIFCNKYVKFGVFLKKALEMGADYVATGHYARVTTPFSSKLLIGQTLPLTSIKSFDSTESEYQLLEGEDKEKDQSYFVYTLNQDQLKHILFPVGGMTKPEVRKMAEKFNLPTAYKKDSQGLCFMGKIDMKEFLSHYIEIKKGDVLNVSGEIIGHHDGAMFLTIGQRHGFTVTKKTANDPRYFIVAKDILNNTITVASKENESESVYSVKQILIRDLHLISDSSISFPYSTSVRIRYRQEKQECTINKTEEGYSVQFMHPQNGVAIGQSTVFYDGEKCLGGGIIEKIT